MRDSCGRRKLLEGLGGALSLGLTAGCIGTAPSGSSGSPSATPTVTDETETVEGSSLAGSTLTVDSRSCGEGIDRATVTFEGTVTVEGVIGGSDACRTAVLDLVSFDGDRLTVEIETMVVEDDGGGACAQCITDISYTARFEFDGSLPDRVVVSHRGIGASTVVADASR